MTPAGKAAVLSILALAAVAAGTSPASAQTSRPKSAPPYTAVRVTTTTLTRPDGTSVTTTTRVLLARDAAGRFRTETDPANDLPPQHAQQKVTIEDPVAQRRIVYWPGLRLAVSQAWKPPLAAQAKQSAGTELPLGTQTIDGTQAQGLRAVREIAATASRPAYRQTTDTWTAPHLGLVLRQSTTVPGSAITTELADLNLVSPPASLFALPASVTPRPAPSASVNPSAEALLLAAQDGVATLPPIYAPTVVMAIARAEMVLDDRKSASADFQSSFRMAAQLPADDGTGGESFRYQSLRQRLESQSLTSLAVIRLSAVTALLTQSDLSDENRLMVYNVILPRTEFGRGRSGSTSDTASPLRVVDGCLSETGYFPFIGVAEVLGLLAQAPEERMQLVQRGYDAAGRANLDARDSMRTLLGLVRFLQEGHQYEPGLDQDLETTLVALLRSSAGAGPTSPLGAQSLPKRRQLFALLKTLDPDRAGKLALEMPAAAESEPSTSQAGSDANGAQTGAAEPAAALQQAEQLADRFQRFVQLVNLAQSLSVNHFQAVAQGDDGYTQVYHPASFGTAAQAAGDAYRMAAPDLLAQQPSLGTLLANVLDRMGDPADAAQLITMTLDQADGDADAATVQPAGEDDLAWAMGLSRLQQYATVYLEAARIEPDVAMARAFALRNDYFRPLALAASASAMH